MRRGWITAFAMVICLLTSVSLASSPERNPDRIDITFRDDFESDSVVPVNLSLWTPQKPGQLTLNGKKKRFTYDRQTILLTIKLPAGMNRLFIKSC